MIPVGKTVTIRNAPISFDGNLVINGILRFQWNAGGNNAFSDFASLQMNSTSTVSIPTGGKITTSSNTTDFFGSPKDYNFISIGTGFFGLPNPVYSPYWNGSPSTLNGPLAIDNSGIVPLPIVLEFFNAKQSGKNISLTWRSATELNNDYYTVERSRDGRQYQEIAKIPGKGTTNEPRDYQTLDKKPILGISYYRLKQTDYDGMSETFKPVVVQFMPDLDKMAIYPNPVVNGTFTVQVTGLQSNENATISISNLQGQRVYERQINTGEGGFLDQAIDLDPGLHSGVYLLTFQAGSMAQTAKLRVGR